MSKSRKNSIWTGSFLSICFSNFIVFLVFYALLTTLPIYAMKNLGRNEAEGALLVTVMLIAAIILRPFSGMIIDKLGKKKTLCIAIFLFSITTFAYLLFGEYNELLILRFVHGISFAVATTAAGAIAADIIPPEKRGEGLGYYTMSTNLAVVAGPFIGLTLMQFIPFQSLFLTLSIITIIGILLSLFVQVPYIDMSNISKDKFSIHSLFEVKALPIAVLAGIVSFAYSGIISLISVFADSIDLSSISSYFFAIFAIVMLVSRPTTGKAFDLRGASFVLIPSLIIFSIGFVALSITGSSLMFFVAAAITGLGYGALLPGFQTMAIELTSVQRTGHATATFFTMYDLGIALGTYLLGVLVTKTNFSFVYLTCALVIVFVTILFVFYQRRQKSLARS